MLTSVCSISKQLVSTSVSSEVVLSDLHVIQIECEALASAAEWQFPGLNFHTAKMLPWIWDWLPVPWALHAFAFLPTIVWLFPGVPLQDFERTHWSCIIRDHPDPLVTKGGGGHWFPLPCSVWPATSHDLSDPKDFQEQVWSAAVFQSPTLIGWFHLSGPASSCVDCSNLSFSCSFSWTPCLYPIISSWNSCGISEKWIFFLKSFVIFFWSCSPSISDALRWAFISQLENLGTCSLGTIHREAYWVCIQCQQAPVLQWRGPASGSWKESSMCVLDSIFSLHLPKTSLPAEHFFVSAFQVLKLYRLFTIKDATMHIPWPPREMHGALGCVSSFQKHQQSPIQVLEGGRRGRRQALHGWSGSTALSLSAGVLCTTPDHLEPSEYSFSEVNRYLATRADLLGWGRRAGRF